jgi:hypothetical protein
MVNHKGVLIFFKIEKSAKKIIFATTCDYLVICDYVWTILQLFFLLVIFITTLQRVCDYFDFHPFIWKYLVWFSSKKNNLCPISCTCDQSNHNYMSIQRCILYILKGIIRYIRIYKFQWECFIGIGLCKMGILVIVIVIIIKSFLIIICHRSNSFLSYFL